MFDRRTYIWWLNIALKLALVALLLVAVAFPDAPQFHAKGFGVRLATYPLAALVVPVAWLVFRRVRPSSQAHYPYATDILVALPFTLDTLGNALNLFDSVDWWDDWMHFLNWMILMGGLGALMARARMPQPALLLLIAGLGSLIAVVWEVGEYYAFIRHSFELKTAYTDTLGDLGLGTAGGVVAALLVTWRMRTGE